MNRPAPPHDSAESSPEPAAKPRSAALTPRRFLAFAALGAVLLWCSQPPLELWPLAFVALIPWLHCLRQETISRRQYWQLYAVACIYWLITLQGLRHANIAIYPCWLALSCYLAVYVIAAVAATRQLRRWSVPIFIAFPVAWVGAECVRNYLLTGISAAMLGHTMADVPMMIQIADLGGTYAVSFVVAMVGAAIYQAWQGRDKAGYLALATTGLLMIATLGYGRYRLGEPTGQGSTNFALIQRSEPVEYVQNNKRALEMFDAYVRQTAEAIGDSDRIIDVVVWPESMFTADLPWMEGTGSSELANQQNLTQGELAGLLQERRDAFEFRARRVQETIAGKLPQLPELIVGCGVLRVTTTQEVFSGVVHINEESKVEQWYGKNHLVMFGEYVPLIKHIPGLRALVPPELGLTTGDGPRKFEVGSTTVAPNLCIETAVERVTLRHVARFHSESSAPEVIVTVTNDGWFDDSAVIDHHRRCAQLVAVGCRRPILSAANNGPTVWIDSSGKVVRQLDRGTAGAIYATPRMDNRISLYVRIGDWPARGLGAIFAIALTAALANRRRRKSMSASSPNSPTNRQFDANTEPQFDANTETR